MLNNFSNKSPPYHVRRRFDSYSTSRSGEDHRTSIGSRSRWGHRGDVRDALDGSFWTVLGAENGPPAFSPRDISLLGGYSESAPPNQPPVPPDANWRGATGAFSEQRRAILGDCVRRAEWLSRYSITVLPNGAHFWYKVDDGLRWLGKVSASTTTDGVFLVRFLDDPGLINLPLTPARYTTSTGAVRDSWCLQGHLARLHEGSNVTYMNLATQSWIADIRIAAAPDSFPFFWVFEVWVFLLGLFLVFCCVLGQGLGCFSSHPVPPTPPAQCRG